ncbi:MAG: hypothetical protein IJC26_08120 [Clostridia bacterium]|nr:hypothetical protein [Clostridia bacterium]
MKAWAQMLILLSLCGKLVKNFLPTGERSALFPPLRFLLSLCLVLALFSPWIKLFRGEIVFPSLELLKTEEEAVPDANTLIMEQIGKTMKRSVDTAFPSITYSLELYADADGNPQEVRVLCDDRNTGIKIAGFIEQNYGLQARAE